MMFGRKKAEQTKEMLKEVMEEAMRQQGQDMSKMQSLQTECLNSILEKNQKAVRNLSDTVEDFLDTLQERDEESRLARQKQAEAAERERRLLELLGMYQEQMELCGQWITGLTTESSQESLEAWKHQYVMMKARIVAEGSFCTIEAVGTEGEPVDYRIHEVLQAAEPETKEQEGTVAKVCSHGMRYEGKVIRKARVVAYKKG